MSRLTFQTHEDWRPLRDPAWIGSLDRTVEQFAEAFGCTWDEYDEDGLGPMAALGVAWDGTSRYWLSVTRLYPEIGISIEVEASEDPAVARRELLGALGLTSEALLTISEGDAVFARWDPPHHAGMRPPTTS